MKPAHKTVYSLALTALLAALTAAITLVHLIPMPNGGYAHVGDSAVYLAGALLPGPLAAVAGALGGGLADLLSGAPLWVPATLVLKAASALCFTAKKGRLLCTRNVLALLAGAAINTVGYYFYERAVFGAWAALAQALLGGLVQSGGSALVFVLAALALDKIKFKEKLTKWSK